MSIAKPVIADNQYIMFHGRRPVKVERFFGEGLGGSWGKSEKRKETFPGEKGPWMLALQMWWGRSRGFLGKVKGVLGEGPEKDGDLP